MKSGKDTKSKILDAALTLIAAYGYKGASIRKIAKAVGIRESAIYNHFPNKEAIFDALLEKIFQDPFDDFFEKKPPSEYAKKGKRILMEYVATWKLVTFNQKQQLFFRIIFQEMIQNEKIRTLFLEKFFDNQIKRLAQLFFSMMQENLIRSQDPMLMAREFYTPLFSYRLEKTLLHLDGKDIKRFSTLFEKHVDFFWESIAL